MGRSRSDFLFNIFSRISHTELCLLNAVMLGKSCLRCNQHFSILVKPENIGVHGIIEWFELERNL